MQTIIPFSKMNRTSELDCFRREMYLRFLKVVKIYDNHKTDLQKLWKLRNL